MRFSPSDELAGEVTEAGFELVELVAVEGPGWLARDFDRIWSIPQQRDRLLAALRKVEHQPALLGASSHILASGGVSTPALKAIRAIWTRDQLVRQPTSRLLTPIASVDQRPVTATTYPLCSARSPNAKRFVFPRVR